MGISAQNQAMSNYKNTVSRFKNLVGSKYSDPMVQEEIRGLPYCVEQLPGDKIGIKVHMYVTKTHGQRFVVKSFLWSKCKYKL